MNLENLKKEWQSLTPSAARNFDIEAIAKSALRGNDMKSRLLERLKLDFVLTSVCLILMATSRIWSPMKLPYWWLVPFCLVLLIAVLYCIRMYRTIKKINLWDNSNIEIMSTVISLKRLYRNIELIALIVILPLLLWISFSPGFINSWRMYFTLGLTVLAFGLEYLWYRSNMKYFNNLIDWTKE